MPKTIRKFEEGKFYTVTEGRFKGIVAVAWDNLAALGLNYRGDTLFSWAFPGDGCISFSGVTNRARPATEHEELLFRREFGCPPNEL
jgi:hypothetical protein